jgi:hypothetical protein
MTSPIAPNVLIVVRRTPAGLDDASDGSFLNDDGTPLAW